MPFHFEEGFTDAVEAFDHGAMCALPGPDFGCDIDDVALPLAEALSGLFTAAALHAVLVAAVEHPEWAAAWRDALSERCTNGCEQLATEFIEAAPIALRSD